MMVHVESKLCPKCGAYWSCECVIEAPAPTHVPAPDAALHEPPQPEAAPTSVCQHDWTQVVGVDLDEDAAFGEAQVLVCRLCGLYAVEKSA